MTSLQLHLARTLIPGAYEPPLHRNGPSTSSMPEHVQTRRTPDTARSVTAAETASPTWLRRAASGVGDVLLSAVIVAAATLAPLLLVAAVAAGPVSSCARSAAKRARTMGWLRQRRRSGQE